MRAIFSPHGVFAVAALMLCLTFAGTAPAFAGDTQIVLQWPKSGGPEGGTLSNVEEALQSGSEDLFFVDGDDASGGTVNVFVFADDTSVKAAVAKIIALHRAGKLPPGLRIGVAHYKDADRTEWDYDAAFPPELKSFALNG